MACFLTTHHSTTTHPPSPLYQMYTGVVLAVIALFIWVSYRLRRFVKSKQKKNRMVGGGRRSTSSLTAATAGAYNPALSQQQRGDTSKSTGGRSSPRRSMLNSGTEGSQLAGAAAVRTGSSFSTRGGGGAAAGMPTDSRKMSTWSNSSLFAVQEGAGDEASIAIGGGTPALHAATASELQMSWGRAVVGKDAVLLSNSNSSSSVLGGGASSSSSLGRGGAGGAMGAGARLPSLSSTSSIKSIRSGKLIFSRDSLRKHRHMRMHAPQSLLHRWQGDEENALLGSSSPV